MWDAVITPDPTVFRPIADNHIARLIHKFNPEPRVFVSQISVKPWKHPDDVQLLISGTPAGLSLRERISNLFFVI